MKFPRLGRASSTAGVGVLVAVAAIIAVPPSPSSTSRATALEVVPPDEDGAIAQARGEMPKPIRDRIRSLIQSERVAEFSHPSRLFEVVLVNRDASAAMQLTREQRDAASQLEGLARNAMKNSIRRDIETLENLDDFTRATLKRAEQQLSASARLRQDATAAADRFLTAGILTPRQSEILQQYEWVSRGVRALRDDRLARRLRLSHEQRAHIEERLKDGDRVYGESHSRLVGIPKDAPESQAADRELRETIRLTEAHVLDVLTPEQREQWLDLARTLPRPPARRPPGGPAQGR